jgi:uncharacterized protein YlxW (UPF0749 family)
MESKILRMCVNWKVLLGAAVAGLVLWVVAPGALAAIIPVVLVAVCPLSMLLMMRAMHDGPATNGGGDAGEESADRGRALADLKAQLARTQQEQETLSRRIARMEAGADAAARRSTADQ